MAKTKATPLMTQYNEIKAKHPGALLLFRVGDFYETFGEDAVISSKILGITLTKRSNGSASEVALAGFPHHSLDTYLPRLIQAGQRVAICEQLEDPSATKKIVKRGVTELVTPGAHLRDNILLDAENNFLCALVESDGEYGFSLVDVSTGEFMAGSGDWQQAQQLLNNFQPNEVLLSKSYTKKFENAFGSAYYLSVLPDWACHSSHTDRTLKEHFKVETLRGFGFEENSVATICAGMIVHYLRQNGHTKLEHLDGLKRIHNHEFLWLDEFTLKNLEVISSHSQGGVALIDVVNNAHTPMGKRLTRRWLAAPSRNVQEIERRHQHIQSFQQDFLECQKIREVFEQVSDIERSIARLAARRINPKELRHLSRSLQIVHAAFLQWPENKALENWQFPQDVVQAINQCLLEDPAVQIGKGRVIVEGKDEALDEVRDLLLNSKSRLEKMLQQETANTGITSLKIGFNQVFGYHFEVRNTHQDKVPSHWVRKQTLVNAERYITPELKEFEEKILSAEGKLLELERSLFEQLMDELEHAIPLLQKAARFIAEIDVLSGWAALANERNYVRPNFVDDKVVDIKGSRHPVIEATLPSNKVFIENDVLLDAERRQLLMITGPNMAGKSALLRQVALCALLAQSGCYVPADEANLPVFDKLFVRVGASDNISKGESTFMVEMTESASILNNLSGKCLILLDEIGRGTSTYDGVSIAWAMASFLHEHPLRPLTLFATHYHELNEMSADYERIVNMNVSVKERGKEILFLRKLIEGGSAHSFGIHVARMAGMPQYVVAKAEEVLDFFEKERRLHSSSSGQDNKSGDTWQMSLIHLDDPLLLEVKAMLQRLEIDKLTPIEALVILNELKNKMK